MSSGLHQSLASTFVLANLDGEFVPTGLQRRKTPWVVSSIAITPKETPSTHTVSPRTKFTTGFRQVSNALDSRVALFRDKRRLQWLPTEIIIEITQGLCSTSAFSLSQTCHRFREMANVFIGDLFPPEKEGRGTIYGTAGQPLQPHQLAFLGMLERDRKLSGSKMICGICKTLHETRVFSSTARREDSSVRKCIGRRSSLWICPHRIWSFDDFLAPEFSRLEDQAKEKCQCPVSVYFNGPAKLFITYPLVEMSEGSELHFEQVVNILKRAKFPFYPHQRSDSPSIIRSFHENCRGFLLRGAVNCKKQDLHAGLTCKYCNHVLQFGMNKWGGNCYAATVLRGSSFSESASPVTESSWCRNLTAPDEFNSLAHEWERNPKKLPELCQGVGRAQSRVSGTAS